MIFSLLFLITYSQLLRHKDKNDETGMKQQPDYTTVEQFLRDDDFIRFVMDCSTDDPSRWTAYLQAAPHVRSAYLKAYDILVHLDDCRLLSAEQVTWLKHRVFVSLHPVAN